MSLCFRCEWRAQFHENKRRPRCECGDIESSKYSCYMYKPVEPLTLEKANKDIQQVFLSGGTSAMPHLIDYLQQNVDISLALFDPWAKINIDLLKRQEYYETAQQINPALYSAAIGSALRGLSAKASAEEINLLK